MLSNSLLKRRARLTSERGFTLIELLVVIAIIAILAAILFPVFASVREKARQTACMSNMNQLAKATSLYKDDFDENFPPMQVSSGTQNRSWPSTMYVYVKSEAVFICPSAIDKNLPVDQALIHVPATGAATTKQYCGLANTENGGFTGGSGGDGSSSGTWFDGTPAQLVHGLSYGMNALQKSSAAANWHSKYNGVSFQTSPPTKQGFVGTSTTKSVTESDVQDPAGTIWLMDAMSAGTPSLAPAAGWNGCAIGNALRAIQTEIKTDYEPDDAASKPAYRHNGGFVALFGDGHSKWVKYGTTKPCMWSIQDDNNDCTGVFTP